MIGSVQDMVVSAIATSGWNTSAAPATSQSAPSALSVAEQGSEPAPRSSTEAVQREAGTSEADNVARDKTGNTKEDKKKEDKNLDESSVSYMTKELNDLMARINCDLQFKYHKELNQMSVKMIDKRDNKVLREIPPEDLIKHMIKAKEWLGAFLDKTV